MLRRRGRHRLHSPVRSHQDIVWCRIQFLGPHREILHQADGFLGHPSNKEQLDLLCLNSNSLGHGRTSNSPTVWMVTTVALLVEVLRTSLGIAPETRSLPKVKILIRTTKARVKSKTCKSGKGRLTLLLLLNFRRVHQLWRVHFLSIISLQLYCLILVQPIVLLVLNVGQD